MPFSSTSHWKRLVIQQSLYFFPLSHGHCALRETFRFRIRVSNQATALLEWRKPLRPGWQTVWLFVPSQLEALVVLKFLFGAAHFIKERFPPPVVTITRLITTSIVS